MLFRSLPKISSQWSLTDALRRVQKVSSAEEDPNSPAFWPAYSHSLCAMRKLRPTGRTATGGQFIKYPACYPNCPCHGRVAVYKMIQPMSQHALQINGHAHSVNAVPDTPLLWVLRDQLKLCGTKFGCGIGQCGACTIHLNGAPARACLTPISATDGVAITTIEGISSDGNHPIQRAWCELDVPQCGYCQAGQIMTAAALLAQHAYPTDAQIDEAMAGNLCRCGTYLRIRQGIKKASVLAADAKNAQP